MITTWKYRIKDSGSAGKQLSRMARAVNFVWNYCKETQIIALKRSSTKRVIDKKTGKEKIIPNFFSGFDFNYLVAGSSKELGLNASTMQAIAEQYAKSRTQYKKLLRWRGRHSLGWIPFKKPCIQLKQNSVIYRKKEFKFWNSRTLPDDAKIKVGSFTQDRLGHWYFNITFESESLAIKRWGDREIVTQEVGIDLGVKTLATLSNGEKIERPDLRADFLDKIRKLERTRKFARKQQARTKIYSKLPKQKQLTKLQAKIANKRKEYLHLTSTKLVKENKMIVIGDLSCAFMNRNKKMSGISLDSGIGMFRQMVRYKADRAGVTYVEIDERNSTQTCSSCGWQHPKQARIGLGVREWICGGCGDLHDRDINAARNILRIGHDTLIRQTA